MESVDVVATTLLVASGVMILGYVLRYTRRAGWRRTQAGRAALFQAIGSLVLILIALGTIIFGFDYAGREVIRLVGYALLLTVSWYSYHTVSRYERARRGLGPDPDPHLVQKP